ncbi:structural protein [Rhodovarius crocodyli]|uniref:Structural protein n=1 Tax=Rhodovarius crocodyli TaxID=1979269 RepID=A0A437LZ57_9PROT|nr:structural protein [Rhodovarius crocodyli]RVT90708.1 structural protein [Rhodovarius crocodyli]
MADPKASRGYRNNNPTNLRYIADPKRRWNGQDPVSADGYGRYSSLALGMRAGVGQLVVNQTRNGLDTVWKQINSWAPQSDGNDPVAYSARVAAALGVGIHDKIDVRPYRVMKVMLRAIIEVELGGMPYTQAEMDEGMALYGITEFSQPAPVRSIRQAATTNSGTAVAKAVGTLAPLGALAPVATAVGGIPWQTMAVLVLAAGIGVAVWLWQQRKDKAA